MIKIVCVGNVKEKFFVSALKEYEQRITKYTKIDIIEVKDEKIIEKALKIEADRILKNLKDSDYVITLEIGGNELSSLELASKIDNNFNTNSNLVFVIGGSYGLDESVKKRSNYALSFSKMTFPHQLFRIILLEQIYRAFKINHNESYHKWIKK